MAQDADGVHGPGEDIRGSYLVACDGGHSTVRKLLGVPFPGDAGRIVIGDGRPDITLASWSAEVSSTREHFSQHLKSAGGFFSVLAPLEGDLYRLMFGKLSIALALA